MCGRRNRLLGVAGIAAAVLSLPVLTPAGEPQPPRAQVAESAKSIGVVAPGERAVAEFTIENRGKAPLELKPGPVEPYVNGVHVDLHGAPVAPGKKATLTISLDTERMGGPGTIKVPLATNDPATPTLDLSVSAEIRPRLVADPGFARYIVVQKEREGTIAQTVLSTDGARFRVLKVELPTPDLRVAFHEATPEERQADAPGSQWKVETTLTSEAQVGALTGDIVVVTDHPRQKRLHIALSGFVRPIFAVTPPVADFGTLDAGKATNAALYVKNFATEEIAIERAESDVPGMSVTLATVTPGRAYSVRVALPANLAEGPLSGKIRLFTASPKAPVIEIPVRGSVAKKSSTPGAG